MLRLPRLSIPVMTSRTSTGLGAAAPAGAAVATEASRAKAAGRASRARRDLMSAPTQPMHRTCADRRKKQDAGAPTDPGIPTRCVSPDLGEGGTRLRD